MFARTFTSIGASSIKESGLLGHTFSEFRLTGHGHNLIGDLVFSFNHCRCVGLIDFSLEFI